MSYQNIHGVGLLAFTALIDCHCNILITTNVSPISWFPVLKLLYMGVDIIFCLLVLESLVTMLF